jgi:hypothetical protein
MASGYLSGSGLLSAVALGHLAGQAAADTSPLYQNSVPGPPLKGPASSDVIQPP